MAWDKMTLGSKKPKKEIDFDVEKKHIFYFFGVLLLIVFMVYAVLINLGFYNVEEMEIICTSGEKELIVHGKVIYCGEHYSTLKNKVSDKSYTVMEEIILYGGEE